MKTFTEAIVTTVNTVSKKGVNWRCTIKKFSEFIHLRPWPLRNLTWWGWVLSSMWTARWHKLGQKVSPKAYFQFTRGKFLKASYNTWDLSIKAEFMKLCPKKIEKVNVDSIVWNTQYFKAMALELLEVVSQFFGVPESSSQWVSDFDCLIRGTFVELLN